MTSLFSDRIETDRLVLELVAVTHVDGNERSKRAIEKYVETHGGSYNGVLRNWETTDGHPRDLHRYTISKDSIGHRRRDERARPHPPS